MITYDFKCPECTIEFEKQKEITDDSAVLCPVCDTTAEQILCASGLIFKGQGFPTNDMKYTP